MSALSRMAQIRKLAHAGKYLVLLAGGLVAGTAWAGLAASITLQSGQPTNIRPGETTVLEINLANNNSTADITGVGFSNSLPGTLPNGLKIAAAPTYTCFDPNTNATTAGTGTLTAVVGTQAIQLSGGVIPRRNGGNSTDGTCTIRIPVTAGSSTGSGTAYTYTILNGAVTGNDGGNVANVGDVSQSVNVTAIARPTITKAFNNGTAYLGGASRTLTITVNNPNPIAIGNFSIADNFPTLGAGGAIIRVANPPNATSTCTGAGIAATFTPNAGDVGVSASGGTLAANGSCTLTVAIEGRHTNGVYTTGSQTNTINATTDFGNDLGIHAQANATAGITVNSPLGVSKGFSPTTLASGQAGSVTITLSNAGSSALNVVSFNDSPIDGIGDPLRGLNVTSVSTTCAGGTASIVNAGGVPRGVSLAGGTIPAGSSCTVTANFTATTLADNTPVTYTNAIPAGAVDVGNPAIVSQNYSATILVADTLRVLKTNDGSAPRPGAPVRYVVTVQNWTNAAMSNVRILDALGNGMTFLTGVIAGLNYTPTLSGTGCTNLTISNVTGDANANFVIGTVPARTNDSTPGACSVAFYAMVSTAAGNGSSTVNTLPAGSVCTDNGAGVCNGGAASSGNAGVNVSTLTATKAFNPAGPLPEGTIARMTITLNNYSANPLSGVSISDTMPGSGLSQLRVATPANAATTCGGTITAVAGSTSVALNGGTLPARGASSGGVIGNGAPGTCVIQVDVVGSAGVFANTATSTGTETYANGTTHNVVPPVTATANITYNSILGAAKSFTPGTVSSGGHSTATIRLTNSGGAALTNVRVSDPLPAGMVLASPTNAYTTCDGATAIAGNPGANSIVLTGATVAGGGTCDLRFDVVATGSASWTNTIPAGNIAALDNGVTNQAPVSGTLNYTPGNNLTVAKATSPSTLAFPGQPSRLTITITNGATAVTGLRLADYFTSDGQAASPANGMVIAASPAPSTTCPGGSVAAAPGGASVVVSGVSLAGSASCVVSVNVTATKTGGVTNYIPVGAIRTDQGLSNTQQATTSLTTQTSIGITKQFTPTVMKSGERSRLRLTFYNGATQPANSLSLTDNLPAGVTVPAGPNPTTTCAGAVVSAPSATQVRVSGGTLAAAAGGVAASCYAEIDVTAAAEGVYVNTIPAGTLSAVVGGGSVTNADPATATLRVKMPVVIHKAIGGFTLDTGNPGGFATGEASRAPGAAAPLVIRLENPNADNLTEAALTDNLPTGLVVAIVPAAATTCAGGTVMADASATSIRLTGATIPANGFCTVTVNVLSNIAGTYTNQIASGALTTFEGVGNEEQTRARIVVTSPPGVGKQFDPPVIPPNGKSRLTIVVDNDNDSNMTLTAHLTDTLPTAPGAMVVANPNNLATTCPGGVGVVQAAIGSPTVRLNSGAVIPPGGCRVEVDVTAALPGSYNNNLPAGALQTNFGSNQQPANAPLLVSTLGYISGKVFLDNLAPLDGIYLAGTDGPIAGEEIQLRSGATCAGTLLFTTHTDAQGNYAFAELPAGTYSVCQPAQPAGSLNSVTRQGSIVAIGASSGTPGTASNPTATSSQIVGIVLGNDGGDNSRVSGSPNNNFSEVATVGIAGTVFMDDNHDGIQQGADAGLAGVQVVLTGTDWQGNPVNLSVLTDASGNYSFSNLPPSDASGYTVTEPVQPPASNNGITTAGPAVANGTAGTATGTSTLPSRISGIVLPPGSISTGNNFAEIGNDRAVYGRVYSDFDDNGSFNGTDVGIGGQVIRLTGNDASGNPVNLSTTTLADGTFAFHGVPESDGAGYTLTQPAQPLGTQSGFTTAGTTGGTATPKSTTPSQITGINLSGANEVSAENLFGEIDPRGPPPPGGWTTTGIPTLSEWGLLALSMLMAWLGLMQVRRRPAS